MTEGPALSGLTVLVTGAARSIGAALSDYLEADGATVWRTDVAPGSGVHLLDVRSRGDWDATVAACVDAHGQIDGLVNNAGIFFGARHFWDETDDELDAMIDVNLKGTWLGTQIVSKVMVASGRPGSIVNLSSTSGVAATKGFAGYGTTRWAVRGFSKFAAGDLAGNGIRVNSLHPHSVKGSGMVTWQTAKTGGTEADLERIAAANPMRRMSTTDDLGGLVSFLLSSRSSFITGREFVIDGGATLGSVSS